MKNTEDCNYILITPTKNEADTIEYMIHSVINQTIKPKIWIFIDNSSDNTPKIIKKYSKKYQFIYLKKQKLLSKRGGHINFSLALQEGYSFAKKLSQKLRITYNYVAKIDADVILERQYFEKLIKYMNKHEDVAIVSGVPYLISDTSNINMKNILKILSLLDNPVKLSKEFRVTIRKEYYLPAELPDKRVYRVEFLDSIGGFPPSKYSPDSVLVAKALINGWKVCMIHDAKLYNLRPDTGTYRDPKDAYIHIGRSRYYLGYNYLSVALLVTYLIIKNRSLFPIAILTEYNNYAKNDIERIYDSAVRKYFCYKRWIKMLEYILHNSYKVYLKNK